jgi:hypothetical protein
MPRSKSREPGRVLGRLEIRFTAGTADYVAFDGKVAEDCAGAHRATATTKRAGEARSQRGPWHTAWQGLGRDGSYQLPFGPLFPVYLIYGKLKS